MLKQYKLRNYHFQLVISILVLNIIGILIIGSAKHSVQKMQILGCIIGMVAMVIVSLMDYSFILRFTWLYYIGIIVLLGLVMTGIGDSAGGAQRWIDFGGFRFQPSELAKIVLILFFARFFSKHAENLNTVKTIGLSFVLIGIPLLLIVKQPDTSTSIAIALIFISLLFIAGLSYKIVLTVIGISIPIGIIGITMIIRMAQSSGDYRFGRIMAWLYPQDPRWSDIAAQQQNSIMAIGSGQLWGKGLNNSAATSMKNANYIIEPQTDFIFAVAGEELGFIGTMVIVLLLLFIVIECILIARKAKDLAGRLICCGMAALIGFQSIFNIFVFGNGVCIKCRITAEKILGGNRLMNIGLVAHDSKKKLMQNFCIAYRGILAKNQLFATGTTGRLIEEVANLQIHKYLAGHLGGSQQLGAQIEHNEIDLVIFLRDPLKPKSHEPDVNSIVRLCDEHNIPLATNLATAELLIKSLDRGDLDWREMYK